MNIIRSASISVFKDLQAMISDQFPMSSYGYYETLKNCNGITVLDPQVIPQFCIVSDKKIISPTSSDGLEYDCTDSSIIIRNWLNERGVKASVIYGELNGQIYHSMVKAGEKDTLGATPIDKYVKGAKFNILNHGGDNIVSHFSDLPSDIIPLGALRPMRWVNLKGNEAAFIVSGMDLSHKNDPSIMTVSFAIYFMKNINIKDFYFYRLGLHRRSVKYMQKLALSNVEEGILESFNKQKRFFIVDETRNKGEPAIKKLRNKYENIMYHLITKIDPIIADVLNIDPNYFSPHKSSR